MHKLIKLIITLFCLSIGFSSTGAADESETYYEFLTNTYNQHEKKLNDFLLSELDLYIHLFPESKNLPAVGYLMAQIYAEKGNKDLAFAMFMKMLYFYPDSPIHSKIVEEAKKIINNKKKYKSRLEGLSRLIDSDFPKSKKADCYYQYLEFLYDLDLEKLYNWNLNEYYAFISQNGSDDRVERIHRWIADTYIAKGNVRAAQTAYLKYEQLYPESKHIPYIQNMRAKILYKNLKDYELALEILSKVIANNSLTDYAGSALYLRGEIKSKKKKDYTGAIADYRQLVTDMPKNDMAVDALFRIADINQDKLKVSKTAIGVYDEIVDSYPQDIRGVDALKESAKIYLKLKDPLSASQQYARIASQFPAFEESPQMLLKAAAICEGKLKNYEKAIEYCQLVIDNYLDTKYADKAEKKIIKLREKLGE